MPDGNPVDTVKFTLDGKEYSLAINNEPIRSRHLALLGTAMLVLASTSRAARPASLE